MCELDLSSSEEGLMAASWNYANKRLGSINDGECLHKINNYQLLKNNSLSWTKLINKMWKSLHKPTKN